MKIKNIEVEGNLILAPMAGYSDVGLRSLAVFCGASFAVTEMVSAKALTMKSIKTKMLLETEDNEKIKVVQLFGSDPLVFAEAVKLPELNKFNIIDINMGCPVSKIIKNNEGSALMKNPSRAKAIIEACVKNTDKPITVKFRRGYSEETCVEFAKMCEEAGASMVTVHGRFAEQGYSGVSDLECIRKVKEALHIPVCASGDVTDKKSYINCLEKTHADFVMIGRGAMGRPYIFSEILNDKFKIENSLDVMLKHLEILKTHNCLNLADFRKHACCYFKGQKGSAILREKIFAAKTFDDIIKIVNDAKSYQN